MLPPSKANMKSRQNQRGQAFVESGLIMLVFLPVLIGIMDFGQFLYLHLSLTERTRAAAHYGAITTYTDGSDIANVAIYNDPAGAANGATPLLPNLQTADSAKDGYVTATLTSAGTDDARIRVTITNYPYNFIMLPTSLNHRTITDTEPYEIGR
jgi:Flp pilus assembly protein TadG